MEGIKPHHRADIFTPSEKITTRYQFSCMGHNVRKCNFLAIRGDLGDPSILLHCTSIASQLSSHLYQSTYKIWKQFDEDFLS